MKDKWNERYANEAYAYGEQANEYLKQCLIQFSPGKVLFPAEGEGRNAVFAAQMGWDVSAFDISDEGQKKAMKLAEKKNVSINYQVGDFKNMNFQKGEFDAIALIYAHFPAAVKSAIHKDLAEYLKVGGLIIFEAFGKNNLELKKLDPAIGGPDDIDMLFSMNELIADFPNFQIIQLQEVEVQLQEGLYHNGIGSVVRFVGRKES
jgi:hypothetical protein